MQSASDRYVILRSGLTLPVAPVLLVLDLEARGFSLTRDAEAVLVRPAAAPTEADGDGLKRWRSHVLALIDERPMISPSVYACGLPLPRIRHGTASGEGVSVYF